MSQIDEYYTAQKKPKTILWEEIGNCPKKPTQATPGSACYDLYADEKRNGTPWKIPPNSRIFVHTGLGLTMPRGIVGRVSIRSGHGALGMFLSNAIGVIDQDFTGELKFCVHNITNTWKVIESGERFAQIFFQETIPVHLTKKVKCEGDTKCVRGGFGSTGKY